MSRFDRCPWIGHLRRCRYPEGHTGPHSYQHGWRDAEQMVGARVRHPSAEARVAGTEAEPRRDPASVTDQDTSLDPWERAGETVEGDLAIAVSVRAHLLTVRDMVKGSAVRLAQAWEPVAGAFLADGQARRLVMELESMADFYRMIAARAYAAQAAVMAGDTIARRIIIDGEGREV